MDITIRLQQYNFSQTSNNKILDIIPMPPNDVRLKIIASNGENFDAEIIVHAGELRKALDKIML